MFITNKVFLCSAFYPCHCWLEPLTDLYLNLVIFLNGLDGVTTLWLPQQVKTANPHKWDSNEWLPKNSLSMFSSILLLFVATCPVTTLYMVFRLSFIHSVLRSVISFIIIWRSLQWNAIKTHLLLAAFIRFYFLPMKCIHWPCYS